MIVLGITVSLSFRVRMTAYLAWGAIAVAIGYLVATSPRLQRFTTLQDTSYVQTRITGSVNEGFLQQAADYPLGNGLGGGGTSIPYFLQDRLVNQVVIENEYGRIMLELGIPGLCIWVAFYFLGLHARGSPEIGSVVHRPPPRVRRLPAVSRHGSDRPGPADLGARHRTAAVSNRLGGGSEYHTSRGRRSVCACRPAQRFHLVADGNLKCRLPRSKCPSPRMRGPAYSSPADSIAAAAWTRPTPRSRCILRIVAAKFTSCAIAPTTIFARIK